MTTPTHPAMRTREVAHELGTTARAVRALLETRRLPGYRLPGLWLIDRDDVTAYRRRSGR